jgi:anti-sigma factor RsiW
VTSMNVSRSDNCKDMRELLSAYHDAELNSDERVAVKAHLESCADCREELAIVESVVKSLKTLPAVTLSKDFSLDIESLIKRSEAETAKQQQPTAVESNVVSISKNKPVLWFAAAAVVAMLMVATYFGTTGGGGVPVVAVNGGSSPTVAKNVQPATLDTATQDKPLVADSEVQPSVTPAAVKPDLSIAAVDKPATMPNRTAKDETHMQAPVVATAKKNAPQPTHVMHVDDLADNQALLAFSELNEDNDAYENIGISTDEDGLYAIKM